MNQLIITVLDYSANTSYCQLLVCGYHLQTLGYSATIESSITKKRLKTPLVSHLGSKKKSESLF